VLLKVYKVIMGRVKSFFCVLHRNNWWSYIHKYYTATSWPAHALSSRQSQVVIFYHVFSSFLSINSFLCLHFVMEKAIILEKYMSTIHLSVTEIISSLRKLFLEWSGSNNNNIMLGLLVTPTPVPTYQGRMDLASIL